METRLEPALAGIHSHISPSAQAGIVCTETSCGEPVGRREALAEFACISPTGADWVQTIAVPAARTRTRKAARAFLEFA
jgi:hypothetical protein